MNEWMDERGLMYRVLCSKMTNILDRLGLAVKMRQTVLPKIWKCIFH